MRIIFLLIMIFGGMHFSYAESVDRYPLPSIQQQQQFQRLLSELRCLVCQNQNLADSQAGLAEDLRNEIYRMVKTNQSDAVIIAYFRERYGEFVLYRPPVEKNTYLLWSAPLLLVLIGFGILIRVMRGHKEKT